MLIISCGKNSDGADLNNANANNEVSNSDNTIKEPKGKVADTTAQKSSTLEFKACNNAGFDESLECADFFVPRDYSRDDGKLFRLKVTRQKATNPQKRKGVILLNFGGPGVGSISGDITVIDEIRESFDIINFDPRGVAFSKEVATTKKLSRDGDCDSAISLSRNVITKEDIKREAQTTQKIYTTCFEEYGDDILHIGSMNVIRDMDEIRKALGEEKINFIGYSYGTRLAALYAQEYPQHTRAFILDAGTPPENTKKRRRVGLYE